MPETSDRKAMGPAPSPSPGYHGLYLRVNVADGHADCISLSADVLHDYIGGVGLGAWLLVQENAPSYDPLSAEAPLAFVFSPLVGSPLTTSAKFAVVCKSPLTGRVNDSLASSGFAIAGKRTGCDAIVLIGRAVKPSVLLIDNGEARLAPADDLWGQDCPAAQKSLAAKFGDDWRAAVIGPAGERQVRYATISHDGRHAGRGGSGAVLGAKNIKAILVRGNRRVSWASPQELTALAKALSEKSFGPATAKYRELGTASNLLVFNRLRALPTRNFQQGAFEQAEALAPETIGAAREKTRASCVACTIGCEHLYSIGAKGSKDKTPVRLEYENLFALGPLCGVGDADVVLKTSRRCDELGMDTISAGGTIAFAMECVERGLLDAAWLKFGDGQATQTAVESIARREGLGDELAEGSRIFAERLGADAMRFAPQVKGLEIPGYEPRALQTMALGFAVGTRGADHNRSGAYEVDFSAQVDRRAVTTDAVRLAIETEDKAAVMDSLILCKFLRGVFDDFFAEAAEMLRLVTGFDAMADDMRRCARRIVEMKKRFNIQAGWTPEEDTLPERFLTQSLSDDPAACLSRERLNELMETYNKQRGWTSQGWIKRAADESVEDGNE